jgi:hypothetical protein
MFDRLGGNRPDITPAQVIAAIPMVALFLNGVGAFDLSARHQHALERTLWWSIALLAADAAIRIGRNYGARGRMELLPEALGGGDLLFTPPTDEELAEAERLEAESRETQERAAAATT